MIFIMGRFACWLSLVFFLGGGWRVVEGLVEGQTQADQSEVNDTVSWCHPIDIHLATRGIQGITLYFESVISLHLFYYLS